VTSTPTNDQSSTDKLPSVIVFGVIRIAPPSAMMTVSVFVSVFTRIDKKSSSCSAVCYGRLIENSVPSVVSGRVQRVILNEVFSKSSVTVR
jgi:hypothetical protein